MIHYLLVKERFLNSSLNSNHGLLVANHTLLPYIIRSNARVPVAQWSEGLTSTMRRPWFESGLELNLSSSQNVHIYSTCSS